jgi:hypothetical protein
MWEIIAKTRDYLKDQWSDKVGNRRDKKIECVEERKG